MHILVRILLPLIPLTYAVAETPVFSPPVLGFAFDEHAKEFIALSGVPGSAASQGRAVSEPVTQTCLDSKVRVGIVRTKDGRPGVVRFGDEFSAVLGLEPGFIVPERCAISGNYAVVTDGVNVQTWTGLLGQPAISMTQSAQELGGAPVSLAVAPNGSIAVLIGETQSVVEFREGSRVIRPNSAATAYVGTDLLVLATDGRLVNTTDGAELAQDLDPESALTANSSYAVAAALKTGQTTIVSLKSGGNVIRLESSCRDCRIAALDYPNLFHLGSPGGGSWLLNVDRQTPVLETLLPIAGDLR